LAFALFFLAGCCLAALCLGGMVGSLKTDSDGRETVVCTRLCCSDRIAQNLAFGMVLGGPAALILMIGPWIAYGIYAGGRNCATLRSMEPELCPVWIEPEPPGFSAGLCCSTTTTSTQAGCQLLRNSSASTSLCENAGMNWTFPYPNGQDEAACCTTLTTTLPATPYCLCNPSGTDLLQCETGLGTPCSNPDMDSKGYCYENNTLCAAAAGCKVEPRYANQGVSCPYKDSVACAEMLHCFYEPSELYFTMKCQSRLSVSAAHAECSALSSRESCDSQDICKWTLVERATEVCENNGTYIGCGGTTQTLDDRCAMHFSEASCTTDSDFCEWRGLCSCTAEFFGDACEKERVQFNDHGGLCPQGAVNSATCKGLTVAAAPQDHDFCSDQQDCSAWLDVKNVVSTMYEAELGDIVADSIAILACFVFMVLVYRNGTQPGKQFGQFMLLTALATFVADIVLELLLVNSVGGAAERIGQLKEALCMPQGAGYESLVLLEDLASSISRLAIANIAIAIIGGLCELYQAIADYLNIANGKTGIERLPVAVTMLAALLELVIGASNFLLQTREFVSVIESIERAAVGLPTEDGEQLCFERHPDLATVAVVGVPWAQPFLLVVLPGMCIFIVFVATTVVPLCRGGGKYKVHHSEEDSSGTK